MNGKRRGNDARVSALLVFFRILSLSLSAEGKESVGWNRINVSVSVRARSTFTTLLRVCALGVFFYAWSLLVFLLLLFLSFRYFQTMSSFPNRPTFFFSLDFDERRMEEEEGGGGGGGCTFLNSPKPNTPGHDREKVNFNLPG